MNDADLSLRAIAVLLGLPPATPPMEVAAAVCALHRKCLDLAMRAPLEIKITSEGEARALLDLESRTALRVVRAADVKIGDWVWGHFLAYDSFRQMCWLLPTQWNERHHADPLRRYVVGPDPALLLAAP